MSEEYPDWQDGALKVVMNGERMCSIWPAERPNALGWQDVGFSGTRAECLEFVERHTDGFCRLRSDAPAAIEHAPPA